MSKMWERFVTYQNLLPKLRSYGRNPCVIKIKWAKIYFKIEKLWKRFMWVIPVKSCDLQWSARLFVKACNDIIYDIRIQAFLLMNVPLHWDFCISFPTLGANQNSYCVPRFSVYEGQRKHDSVRWTFPIRCYYMQSMSTNIYSFVQLFQMTFIFPLLLCDITEFIDLKNDKLCTDLLELHV
jgi:hypothetical protein